MGKMLIVAEKPSVANDIAKALGGFKKTEGGWLERDDIAVSCAIGHLVEIFAPEAETTGKSLATLPVIPAVFQSRVIEKTKSQFTMLKKLMARSDIDQIVNACDAGREGELIFRLIYELAGCRKPMKRMWLQSMTPGAIKDGFQGMRPAVEFDALGDAAKCRSESDWIVGINGSRGVTRLREIQSQSYDSMAVGRVQTPTLAIMVHRELEIRNFVPESFWEIHGTFAAKAGTYPGKWMTPASKEDAAADGKESAGSRLFDKDQAEAIVRKCRGVAPSSVKDLSKPLISHPPKLYDLTTLQREANKKYKFSAKHTLGIAQSLYEKHKATTYPRTDSNALPEDYIDTAKSTLASFDGTDYANHAQRVLQNNWVKQDKRVFDNSKISDHFAIVPSGLLPSGLSADEQKIYDMVVRRFIAVFHPAAEYMQTTRITTVEGERFRSGGKVLQKPGWLAVYGSQPADDDKAPSLCAVIDGERVATERVESKAMQTKPPARFSEATLLGVMDNAGKQMEDDELREAMEGKGLGTPATRAATIEGLLNDIGAGGMKKEPYIRRDDNYLVPTSKAIDLVVFLESNGLESLTSPNMTGEWEHKLHLMEKRQYTRQAFMSEIGVMTQNMIAIFKQRASEVVVPDSAVLSVPCPKCKGKIISKLRTYECGTGCGVSVWKEICSRKISEAEATQLLRDGRTDSLSGFISKTKKTKYSAPLKLTAEHKVEFDFSDSAPLDSNGVSTAPALKVKCPKCGGVMRALDKSYACDAGDFTFRKEISGRVLTAPEAEYLIEKKVTPKANGFFSEKKNKAFIAGYQLTEDFTVQLYF